MCDHHSLLLLTGQTSLRSDLQFLHGNCLRLTFQCDSVCVLAVRQTCPSRLRVFK